MSSDSTVGCVGCVGDCQGLLGLSEIAVGLSGQGSGVEVTVRTEHRPELGVAISERTVNR